MSFMGVAVRVAVSVSSSTSASRSPVMTISRWPCSGSPASAAMGEEMSRHGEAMPESQRIMKDSVQKQVTK